MGIKRNHMEESEKAKWQYRRNGEIISFGSELTLPSPEERRQRREDGYEFFIDGKPEGEKKGGKKK